MQESWPEAFLWNTESEWKLNGHTTADQLHCFSRPCSPERNKRPWCDDTNQRGSAVWLAALAHTTHLSPAALSPLPARHTRSIINNVKLNKNWYQALLKAEYGPWVLMFVCMCNTFVNLGLLYRGEKWFCPGGLRLWRGGEFVSFTPI